MSSCRSKFKLISAYSRRVDRNVRAFSLFRDCSHRFFEPQAVNPENSVFRRIRFDEGMIFFDQTGDQLPIEKIRRIAHRCLVMAIETKNVRQKAHAEFCLRNSQP